MTAYDVELHTLDGSGDVMSQARGKVTLLVNVASKCGLTPQYEQLEALQKELGGDSFTVLGVPCNQFLEQEPGSAEEIATFCSTTYGVTFPLSEKIEVNGDGRHELYDQLVDVADDEGHTGDIRWNFEKFLIGSDGSVIARFDPTTVPDDPKVTEAISAAMG
ncbi:MAG: glutathione peroxidase [Microthrixaceae bacterium]